MSSPPPDSAPLRLRWQRFAHAAYQRQPFAASQDFAQPGMVWDDAVRLEQRVRAPSIHRLAAAPPEARAQWESTIADLVVLAGRMRHELGAWPALIVFQHPSLAPGGSTASAAERRRRIHGGLECTWDPSRQYHFSPSTGSGSPVSPRLLWRLTCSKGDDLAHVRPIRPTPLVERYASPYELVPKTSPIRVATFTPAQGVWFRVLPGRSVAPAELGAGGHRRGGAGDQTYWFANQLSALGRRHEIYDRWTDLALRGDTIAAWAETLTPQQVREALGHYLRLPLTQDDQALRPWVLQQLGPRLNLPALAAAADLPAPHLSETSRAPI